LIARNPITGDREQTIAAYSNLGTINTSGIDMSLAWSHEVGPGNFAVNSTLSWLSKYDYQPVAGGTTNVAKGTLDQGGQYDYRLLTNFSYRVADINLGLQWRHLPAVESAAKGIAPTTTQQGTGTYDVFGLNASYNMGKVTFRAGIDNLLNKAPPSLNYIPGGDSNTDNTNPSFYDILGRRFFVGVKAKL
jgi:outer membrane receptor for ferrienterochelin and colicin